ncbi:WhiB family transcriptional regulator [Streptomyces sp. NPDC060000]|uniref:WhiB family transcriptional regulator n=1 Tax=Streptomyces sp. NPDC060000 TaxID=3347031 RepID=UPI0036894E2D
MASHTALPTRPARGPARGAGAGAHTPDAALPCQRRPDVFQHPLLEAPPDIPHTSPEQRHQHLVLLRTARDLCASCPLWAECLQDAVAHAEPYGYAAATTLDDRRWLRRALGVGDVDGDLPTHLAHGPGYSSGETSRRLLRLRSRTNDPAARHAAERGLPTLERILDAFDARQDQLASARSALPAIPRQLHEHTTTRQTHSSGHHPRPTHPESRSEDMAAAESGQRIAFSYEDPAQAVRQALLAPLIRSALPTLTGLEQLVMMLASVPGGEIAPEMPENLRAVRKAIEALAPEGGQGFCGPAEAAMEALSPLRTITGSVSVELATTDPVAALRRDFLEPLLRELASSLANMEKVVTMLAATSDGDEVHLEPIRTALQGIRTHLPHPAPAGKTSTTTGQATFPPSGTRRPATPSIRAAVETAVSTFPGPFSAREVLRALPPGVYGDPSKTISNVLSALVKSGRLQRLARGTYARTVDVTMDVTADVAMDLAADVPEQDEAKSARAGTSRNRAGRNPDPR